MLDVAVLGGGLIGCATARLLARAGLRVALFERGRIGGEASGAAAGMLGVQSESADDVALRLGLRSRALYPALLEALADETGMRVECWREGTLGVAFTPADTALLDRRLAMLAAAGAAGEAVPRARLRTLEPALSHGARGGALFPLDGRLDPVALTTALARAAGVAGCTLYEGEEVRSVVVERGAVVGVVTAARRLACSAAVNAMGAWAGRVRGMTALPVQPMRGQIAVVQAPRPPLRHALRTPRGYAVARRDGRVLFGSTRESVGYRKQVTAGGLSGVLGAALELTPALCRLPLVASWSGLRPATADGRPIVSLDPLVRHYVVATGHDADGVLLAPLSAELAAGLLRGERSEWDEVLSVTRFAGAGAGAALTL
ncbi:MAG TPA: glycine oxidase ThiO [Candidatus Dormibacteraeota bacterium]|nr:glycine oxidase ThiO [Candidatus Dormibacteraeota bacterium]